MNTTERALARLGDPCWIQNWTLDGLSLYAEIMHAESRTVWLSQQAITPQEYAALLAPQGYFKSGMGRSAHDAAFFRRGPGGDIDGPLETLDVAGRIFSKVAIPGQPEPIKAENAMVGMWVSVDKHHSVMFAKGRTIEILNCGDEWDYVPQVTAATGLAGMPGNAERVLPEGWSVREIILEKDLFIAVPNPARVCFFASGHSFQGPVKFAIGS